MKQIRLVIGICILLFQFTVSNAQETFKVAETTKDLRFIWGTKKLPANTRAVVIKVKNKKKGWVPFSNTPLVLGLQANYKQVSNSPTWQLKIAKHGEKITTEQLKSSNIGEVLASFRLKQQLALATMLSYNNALLLGFAYVYEGKLSKRQQEFGLFLIDNNGIETTQPVETAKRSKIEDMVAKANPIKFQFNRHSKKIRVLWECPEKEYNKHKITRGLEVYKTFDSTETHLNDNLILPSKYQGFRSLHLDDRPSLDTTKTTRYAIRIQTVFDLEVHSAQKVFDPNNYPLKPIKVLFTEKKSTSTKSIKLAWALKDKKNTKFISHYILYKQGVAQKDLIKIAQLDSSLSYTDHDVLEKKITITKSKRY